MKLRVGDIIEYLPQHNLNPDWHGTKGVVVKVKHSTEDTIIEIINNCNRYIPRIGSQTSIGNFKFKLLTNNKKKSPLPGWF